ncbi:helix-turn-helix transcriptional regulator [Streptomyces longwoodensis]|uniref:helix-turn-helix transcriptional regulator n=1 Tax=Streptomyces longwoodensis TaxID=68231 RepID=UPI0037B5F58E
MPKNPEREGSPRLITIGQIAEEHGVSRSSVHTYRRRPTFPQPVPVEGSTRPHYRADEVAAWFEANPPQQGKRTDLAPKQEGQPVAGLDNQEDEDRELLLNASVMIERRWPDQHPTLVRDLRDLADLIGEEAGGSGG